MLVAISNVMSLVPVTDDMVQSWIEEEKLAMTSDVFERTSKLVLYTYCQNNYIAKCIWCVAVIMHTL